MMKRKIEHILILAGLFLAPACGGGKEKCQLTPAEGSLAGYYQVTVTCPDRSFSSTQVPSVRFGENFAVKIQVIDSHAISATVQGVPEPGKVDVSIDTDGSEQILKAAFTYLPAADPVFDRMFAIGASWTMGVQSGSFSPEGQLNGPAAQFARRVGAYFPLPLVKFAVPAPVQVADLIGHCSPEDLVNIKLGGIEEVVSYVSRQNEISLAVIREDPDIQVQNLAIGGAKIHDVIYGGGAMKRIDIAFLENLVYFPRAPLAKIFVTPEVGSQLDLVEAGHPTLVMITDLFANDLAPAVFKDGLADPALATPLDSFRDDTRTLLSRLSATGAEVFVGNLGHPITLPWLKEKIKVLEHEGHIQEIDKMMAEIETMVEQYTGIFAEEASPYSNIHIVDLASAFAEIDGNGLLVGSETLTTRMFGGLISLDGIHPSRTGYALYANLFLESVNTVRGLDLPLVDLAPVLADDPLSPSAIQAAGLDPDLCQ